MLYIHSEADPGTRARDGRGDPRPARRLQPPEPRARRPGGDQPVARTANGLSGQGSRGSRLAARDRGRGRQCPATRPRPARLRVGERAGADRDGDPRRRRRSRGCAAHRQRGDLRARCRHRRPTTRKAANRFLDGYRGTAAFWRATTRFTDGFELTGAPETGINVDVVPGPRGPVTYRDLWLRQYRVSATAPNSVSRPVVVKLGTGLVVDEDGAVRDALVNARAREIAKLVRRRGAGLRRLVRRDRARPAELGLERRPRTMAKLQAASALGQARLQAAWEDALGARGDPRRPDPARRRVTWPTAPLT